MLYYSPHGVNKDVFLFFKGYRQGSDDLEEVATEIEKDAQLQIAFIDLVPTEEKNKCNTRNIRHHCENFKVIDQ